MLSPESVRQYLPWRRCAAGARRRVLAARSPPGIVPGQGSRRRVLGRVTGRTNPVAGNISPRRTSQQPPPSSSGVWHVYGGSSALLLLKSVFAVLTSRRHASSDQRGRERRRPADVRHHHLAVCEDRYNPRLGTPALRLHPPGAENLAECCLRRVCVGEGSGDRRFGQSSPTPAGWRQLGVL